MRRAVLTLAVLLIAVAGPHSLARAAAPEADVALVGLDLPTSRPASFEVVVPHAGRLRTLVLERHSLRAHGMRVQVHPGGEERAEATLPTPATYRGHVAEDPDSAVVANLGARGLTAHIVPANEEETWSIVPGDGGRHRVFDRDTAVLAEPVDCPVEGHPPTLTQETAGSGGGSGGGQHLAQIAFDVDYQYYLLKGSSVQASVDAVEAIMNVVDFFYARDLLVTYEITHVLVRTSQYYFPTGGGNLLDLFRQEWNTNQAGIVRDMAHLMTDKDNLEFGGLAWVGAVCNDSSYGWSLDSANIVGHELGHNWGSGHCHDVSPCNNMCGGCFYIAPATKDIMSAYRDSRTCLDDAGAYATPVPPYAHPEGLDLSRDELLALPPTAFDVLGNDHDGNLDPLSLDGFAGTTERGGVVVLSPGTGPGGRDELVYSPPGTVFPGADRFGYTVGDGTGLDAEGSVRIDVPAPTTLGYWPLDDGAGASASDHSNQGRHGELEGGAAWAIGTEGGGLRFNGVDAGVSIPPLELRGDAATISTWIYRIGTQNPFASLVFSRDGDTTAGLNFGNGHELRYHWNDASSTWSWNSGLVVPVQQWVFAALVIEPHQATMYLHDGTTLQSATNPVAHGIEEFNGLTKLGYDPGTTVRYFRGVLDDVRILDHALDAGEILDLAERGGRAVGPNPLDGGRLTKDVARLSWTPGLSATSHDVYVGSDYLAVRDATPASPELVANVAAPSLDLEPGTDPGEVTYWRVDEQTPAGVIPGRVWLLSPARTAAHWRLDESAGGVAVDTENGNDGTFIGGVTLGQPAALPWTGRSILLDGLDDYVEVPALNLDAEELTITGWARRDGIQSDWAGLVFSRSGSTVAGVSVRAGGELRYHWNGGQWDWSSGLFTPDAEWFFFALVVQPDRASLYLGDAGVLDASTHWTLHGLEPFDGTLDLGRDATGARHFEGGLDDIRIYEAALTPRDIETIYQHALLGPGTGAGAVPDGANVPGDPLRVGRTGTGDVELAWGQSCVGTDADYAVYAGTMGSFASHAGIACTTGGATDLVVAPGAGDLYYLVVPLSADREGGYGTDSTGAPRSPAASACLEQLESTCE